MTLITRTWYDLQINGGDGGGGDSDGDGDGDGDGGGGGGGDLQELSEEWK